MNLDTLKLKPNQLADFDPTECTALSAAALGGTHFNIPFNPDFTYAASLDVQGISPTITGSDPRAAMFSGCLFGYLPQTDETFTAKTMGELYASNFANYSQQERTDALAYTIPFKPIAPDWRSIVNTLKAGNPISLPIKWFWGALPPTVLTMPNIGDEFTLHNVVIWDWEDPRGLTIQPWLGTQGENGYFYLPQNVYEAAQSEQPFCLAPQASRKLQIISGAIVYYPVLMDIAKSLLQ
jgi:hypothetical protein